MKRYFYFVARYTKNGKICMKSCIQGTNDGYFDFDSAAKHIAQTYEIDFKEVIITFWSETNSKMLEKCKN